MQSRSLAVAALAVFFILAMTLTRSNTRPVATSTVPDTAIPEIGPQESSGFMLKDFHRSETKDGRTLWEVNSSRGNYYPETNSARVEDAVVRFYRDDGKVVELRTGEALLELEGSSLKTARAGKGVKIVYDDNELVLETDRATYDRQANKVNAPGFVKIINEMGEVSGVGFDADLQTRILTLSSQVKSFIKPREKS